MPGKVLPFQQLLAALNHIVVKKRFKTVEAMCQHFGFDADTMKDSLLSYAQIASDESQDEYGKTAKDAAVLQAPFHVIDISLAQQLLPCSVLTMGGLAVDEATGQVVNQDQQPIQGLYAAGRTAVGIPSKLYMSGLSLADCVFSGRRAGSHAAKRA